jgi:hypothetical protein
MSKHRYLLKDGARAVLASLLTIWIVFGVVAISAEVVQLVAPFFSR